MTNNQTYYVVFFSRRLGVYDSWVECQKNVLLYKGSVYKSYASREEAVQTWVFYTPRWKRSYEIHQLANQCLNLRLMIIIYCKLFHIHM